MWRRIADTICRRLAGKAAVAAERRYQRLFNDASVMHLVTRNEGGIPIITDCNDTFLQTLGYQRSELIGRPLTEFYAPESRVNLLDRNGYQRALEGAFDQEDRHLLRRDGSRVAALLRAGPEFDDTGNIIGTQGTFIDISARKRMEEDLRRSEEKFRAVFRSVSEVIYVTQGQDALTGATVLVGEQVKNILGYECEELLGHRDIWLRNVHPDDMPSLVDRTRKIVESGEPGVLLYRYRHKLTGEWLWLEDRFSPQFSEEGRFTGMLGVARDISSHRRRDTQLELLSRVVHHSGDACMICNRDGVIQYVNPAFANTSGYAVEEVTGKTPAILKSGVHSDAFYRDMWLTLFDGKVFRAEFTNRKKNGELFDEEKTISPVLDVQGQITHFISVGRDVTARKSAEKALRDSEQRYRELVENANDIIYRHDASGRFLALNRAGERIFGCTRAAAQELHIWDFVAPVDHEKLQLAIRQARNTPNAPVTCILAITPRIGPEITVEASVRPILAKGEVFAVEGVARDISERKRIEEKLRESQRVEALGRLTGGIAHDFNNLLTIINGFSEAALRSMKEDAEARNAIEEVRKAGGRAAGLTRQLLAFGRQQLLRPRAVDLNAHISEISTMLRRLAGERIGIHLDLCSSPAVVHADPTQLEQVLLNLTVNARDAMPGGGRLDIATSLVELDAAFLSSHPSLKPGRHVMLTVSDTGCGMDPPTLERIFEPFFTSKEQGTGLGLSIVHGIVQQSLGAIAVESRPGEGTIFRIYLPAAGALEESTGAAIVPSDSSQPADRARATILVIEDEPAVLRLVSSTLREEGHTVLTADGQVAALDAAKTFAGEIDLVLTDILMPGTSGPQLVAQLRESRPAIKVLYMTGFASHEVLETVLRTGTDVIEKPMTADVLQRKVRAVIQPPAPRSAILVVDDEAPIRKLIRGLLEQAGHQVAEAADGREAFQWVQTHPVQLVIMDLSMPKQEGIETISQLRSEYPGLKILAISGAFRQFLIVAEHLGAHATMSKPIDAKALQDTVELLLRQSAS